MSTITQAFIIKTLDTNLERSLTQTEFKNNFNTITNLAKTALAQSKSSFSLPERSIVALLAKETAYSKIEEVCSTQHVRLLPLLMKLAEPKNLDQLADPEWYDKNHANLGENYNTSLRKNGNGIPEQILPGLFLGNYSACAKRIGLGKNPLIVSILKEERERRAGGGTHKPQPGEICLTGIKDEGDNWHRIVKASSEDTKNVGDWFEKTFVKIDQALLEKRDVLIHCYAGQSRSASFLAAYLVKRFGITGDEAFNFLIQKRACVRPNDEFLNGVRDYAKALRGEHAKAQIKLEPKKKENEPPKPLMVENGISKDKVLPTEWKNLLKRSTLKPLIIPTDSIAQQLEPIKPILLLPEPITPKAEPIEPLPSKEETIVLPEMENMLFLPEPNTPLSQTSAVKAEPSKTQPKKSKPHETNPVLAFFKSIWDALASLF